jgi:hypothetical protein
VERAVDHLRRRAVWCNHNLLLAVPAEITLILPAVMSSESRHGRGDKRT